MGKNIKKFNEFVNELFEQTPFLPIAPKSSLALYFQCEKCELPKLAINEILHSCEHCGGHMKEIDEAKFYKILKDNVSPTGWEEIQKKRREFQEDMLDLTKLKPEESPRANVN